MLRARLGYVLFVQIDLHRSLLLGARTLLGAPGIATRSKDATRCSWHLYERSKDAIRSKGHRYERSKDATRGFMFFYKNDGMCGDFYAARAVASGS